MNKICNKCNEEVFIFSYTKEIMCDCGIRKMTKGEIEYLEEKSSW